MKQVGILALLVLLVVPCAEVVSLAATVDFESVPAGTKYGASFGNAPGEVVLSQDGVDVSVEEFLLGSFVGFIKAEVGGVYAGQFPTVPLELDNISVLLDFSGVGFDVTMVTLDYKEFGGSDNVAVNGYMLYQLGALTDIPADVAPGITATVVQQSTLTLEADGGHLITDLLVGGQELVVDNIVAVPEPTMVALLGLGGLLLLRRRSGKV